MLLKRVPQPSHNMPFVEPTWERSTNYQMGMFKRNHRITIAGFLDALMKARILNSWTVIRWDSNHIIQCTPYEEPPSDTRLP